MIEFFRVRSPGVNTTPVPIVSGLPINRINKSEQLQIKQKLTFFSNTPVTCTLVQCINIKCIN